MEKVKTFFAIAIAFIALVQYALAAEDDASLSTAHDLLTGAKKIKIVGVGVPPPIVAQITSAVKKVAKNAKIEPELASPYNINKDKLLEQEDGYATIVVSNPDAFDIVRDIVKEIAANFENSVTVAEDYGYAEIAVNDDNKPEFGVILAADNKKGRNFIENVCYCGQKCRGGKKAETPSNVKTSPPENETGTSGGRGASSTSAEGSGNGGSYEEEKSNPAIEAAPRGIPPEPYVAIPVSGPGIYRYGGRDYNAVCSEGYCIVVIPKRGIHGVKVIGHTIIPSDQGNVRVFDAGAVTIAKSSHEENDRDIVEYVAKGNYPVSIEINIPKNEKRMPKVFSDVEFLETDPVIKIYLETRAGNVAIRQLAIDRDAKVVETRIRFESCSLRIGNVSTIKSNHGNDVAVSFQILDGDNAVYVPRTEVRIGGKSVTPQFDPVLKTYVASARVPRGTVRVSIEADAEGCGPVAYTEQIYVGNSVQKTVATILAIIAVAAVAVALLRVVWH